MASIRLHCHKNNNNNVFLFGSFIVLYILISEISCIVIEKITSQGDAAYIDRLLLTREAYWTAQFCTLSPHSLNKRREFRSKNRLRYNT